MSDDPRRPRSTADHFGLELHCGRTDLGAIDEVITYRGRHFFVVDTRHWTCDAQRLVPVELVEFDDERQRAWTAIGAALIRSSPDFNPFKLDVDAYWRDVLEAYDGAPPG